MLEAAVLVGLDLNPLHWHLPLGRTNTFLPDSSDLWTVIWENRDHVLGLAHSHPGSGTPLPSYEDLTTFAAIEAALGKRLQWWIVSEDSMIVLSWLGPARLHYKSATVEYEVSWLAELRALSKY